MARNANGNTFMDAVRFNMSTVFLRPDLVRTVFWDDTYVDCEIEKGNNPAYKKVAQDCGYGDDWRLYALHHDLVHNYVAEYRLGCEGGFSLGLYFSAKGVKYAGYKAEEYLVNTVQWVWATSNLGYHDRYLRDQFGHEWISVLGKLGNILHNLRTRPSCAR